jgi:methylenetetrahydrofolate--tRNA-(uracil-5-)-methyltransferase
MPPQLPFLIIGAGLAGSECAWQLARRGVPTVLVEMRPAKMSPAHHGDKAAELVCSNSLRSNDIFNAVGLLKEEMAGLDSLIIRAAYAAQVPAGTALAVDRDVFSNAVEAALKTLPNLKRVSGEVIRIDHEGDGVILHFASGEKLSGQRTVIATGPLTADPLAAWLKEQTQNDSLYFYDSIAPIVDAQSIDRKTAFMAARYGRGDTEEGDYINCPMTEAEYQAFIAAILEAELAEVHDFDKAQFFEGCLPIEEMVRRGPETLRFGPMKAVGITNPHAPESRPYAIVQLRQDNRHASLYNMVGFQTRMKWPEQKRIFQMIPGLAKAEFVRMGSMHRNTYVCSPLVLDQTFALKNFTGVHLAGQITGCEGYVESAAIGLMVGLILSAQIQARDFSLPPASTALGALVHHILSGDPENYQPMNVNFGLFTDIPERARKKIDRKVDLIKRASADFRSWFYRSI